MAKKMSDVGTTLGFEAQLWAPADKLRGNMEPTDYKDGWLPNFACSRRRELASTPPSPTTWKPWVSGASEHEH